MSTKNARGTKRTCQSSECGERFYDLNRDPIICPICGTIYEIAHAPPGTPVEIKDEKPERVKQAAVAETDGDDTADDLEGADEIEDIETDDDAESSDDSDTFLEEDEEEGGTVTDIIAPVKEGDEES